MLDEIRDNLRIEVYSQPVFGEPGKTRVMFQLLLGSEPISQDFIDLDTEVVQ